MSQKIQDGLGPIMYKQPQGTKVPLKLAVGDRDHESVLPTSLLILVQGVRGEAFSHSHASRMGDDLLK